MRHDGRDNVSVRPIRLERDYIVYPEGSVLLSFGHTRVLCNASIEHKVPQWLSGRGQGWVSAEYAMLPRATHKRSQRDSRSGKPNSRALEISRLIGRSLRSVVDLNGLGERTITIDCDVLQADGGTRTAAISGAFLAVELALEKLVRQGSLDRLPLRARVAAVSVGLVDGEVLVDLDYDEDSRAAVDLNIVQTDRGDYIELQGTAEKSPFSPAQLEELLAGARAGISAIFAATRPGE